MIAQLKAGDRAPDFILPDEDKNPRSLQEFLGKKAVLVFLVGAFTKTCTKEACEFRDSMARLIDLNAQVVGVDITVPAANKRFSEKNRLPFPVLADNKREVFEKYGLKIADCKDSECCWGTGCYPIAKRSIYVLDQNGFIQYAWVSDNAAADPSYEEINNTLKQIT